VTDLSHTTDVRVIDVAVIDDHMVIHDGVRAMAEREPDLNFVGGATNPQEALLLVERTAPALVLLDVRLGPANGFELCTELRGRFPATGVLIFSAFCNSELLTQAIRAGAGGYVLKDTDTGRLPAVIRQFHQSGTYFDPQVAGDLLIGMVGGEGGRRTETGLSDRDRHIIRLIAQGASNYDIATELNLSSHTVKFHVTGLLRRFGVNRRVELVKVAMERQLVD
jgi:DNA-binding NarL/FixJ family response regulator